MRDPQFRYHALITTEDLDPANVHSLLELRKRLFVDGCGWNLAVDGDIERDQFDDAQAHHCLLFRGGQLVGGFRAIRTDFPYLSQSVFARLATRPFPRRADAWEISRFGILADSESARAARMNYAFMFRFAELRRANALVALADPTYERFLARMGIGTNRYGPPQIIDTDAHGAALTAVVGEIPLGAQDNPRVAAFLELAKELEIRDEAHVLGRPGVSEGSAEFPAGARQPVPGRPAAALSRA